MEVNHKVKAEIFYGKVTIMCATKEVNKIFKAPEQYYGLREFPFECRCRYGRFKAY